MREPLDLPPGELRDVPEPDDGFQEVELRIAVALLVAEHLGQDGIQLAFAFALGLQLGDAQWGQM
jgi:hypothetical protein